MTIGMISTKFVSAALVLLPGLLASADPLSPGTSPSEDQIRDAVGRALPLLERASAGSADQRTCFTCHSQALPVFSIVESQRRGFSTNVANLRRQIKHTHRHLLRGRKSYEEGNGQGGGVDTAGYALWTLEEGGWPNDERRIDMDSDAYATSTVLYALRHAGAIDSSDARWKRALDFLLSQQLPDGSWFVKSRSKPFQTYFESGFPHEKDQFISTAATSWATLALLQSLPEKKTP